VQLHGDEDPEACYTLAYPYYKALRCREPSDAAQIRRYGSPRVLVDAFDRNARGGTGKRLSREIVNAVSAEGPLWLAGGLRPQNVREVVASFRPELVDVSSGVEAEPGKKDAEALKRFFDEIAQATSRSGNGGESKNDE
jgi:indole-3-glycerol phosphate synthase/phosphoribosylanthranilate isomerase